MHTQIMLNPKTGTQKINIAPKESPLFKLWIKFSDTGEVKVLKSQEYEFTVSQVMNRPGLLVDYREAYRRLIELVEVTYQGRYSIARIYYQPTNEIARQYNTGRLVKQRDPIFTEKNARKFFSAEKIKENLK